MRQAVLAISTGLFVLAAVGSPAAADPPPQASEKITKRVFDEHGRLVWEFGELVDRPDLGVARHFTHVPKNDAAKGGGGGSAPAMTDCASRSYRLAPWHWSSPYSANASSYATVLDASGSAWDAATSASVWGGIRAGSTATAGVQDFVNQHDWVDLGATSTIAVTTTWYYLSTGVAVESDARYNSNYAWSTDGSPGAMDVQNIATHELGHTLGLDHPKGKPASISCLTMYAYGSLGETLKQTLGDGDILGVRAIYGA